MSSFDGREKNFENKYVHDQELDFKIRARRNKLLSEWAAEKLHIAKSDWDKYTSEVIQSAVGGPKHVAVKEKILADFADAGIEIDENELEKEMNRLFDVASEQVRGEA